MLIAAWTIFRSVSFLLSQYFVAFTLATDLPHRWAFLCTYVNDFPSTHSTALALEMGQFITPTPSFFSFLPVSAIYHYFFTLPLSCFCQFSSLFSIILSASPLFSFTVYQTLIHFCAIAKLFPFICWNTPNLLWETHSDFRTVHNRAFVLSGTYWTYLNLLLGKREPPFLQNFKLCMTIDQPFGREDS